MKHLILGYGYCGFHLAQLLLHQKQDVIAVSRNLNPHFSLPSLVHLKHDLNKPFQWDYSDTIIYYLTPPSSEGDTDVLLKKFLQSSRIKAKKIIYFGSSAVYGDHQGAWINEESECLISNSRQRRRLDAELQWRTYCDGLSLDYVLLRISGIYGPNRIPIDAAKNQTSLILQTQAPFTNHIFVKDLVSIAWLMSQKPTLHSPIFNISDGDPKPMGTLQELVAKALHYEPASRSSFAQAYIAASTMKKEFMDNSKRLSIEKLKSFLGDSLHLTDLPNGVLLSLQ